MEPPRGPPVLIGACPIGRRGRTGRLTGRADEAVDFQPIVRSPVVDGYRNKCEFTIGYARDGKVGLHGLGANESRVRRQAWAFG